jgi:hypothetical protein
MNKKYKKQPLELMELGRIDLEHNGMVSIRGTIVYADGKETMFPPPGTNGVLINLHKDSARMAHKKIMRHRIAVESDIEAMFFLHYRVIYELADLVKHPNRFSLYVLGMTAEESIFVRQDYTLDDSKKLVFGELAVLDHDPEDEFLVHGFLAERALGMPDEMFAKVPQETFSESFPQEWIDYIHRERENRDEDEWYSPKREPDSSDPDTEQGGSHEVFDLEETV